MIYCFPLFIAEIFFTKSYKVRVSQAMTLRNICGLLITPIFYSYWSFTFLYGAANMIQSHAYLLSVMYCIFIVLIGYCLCLKPCRIELLGLFLTCAGVACMLNDPNAERTDGKVASLWHYAICISGAIGAAFYMLINGILVKEFPIFTLILT